MLLILTHEHADFDAVASQLAAYKLFPDGIPLLPEQIRQNVQSFLALYWDRLPFMRHKEWQPQRVDAAMLVDTQQMPTVRGISYETEVRVIDHQLLAERPLDWQYKVEMVGATTTLLAEELHGSGLVLSAEEATLLLLGIYEETGGLLHDSTTQRDVLITAWLLEQGAQLAVVRRFLQMPLSPEQEQLYGLLQQQVSWQKIHGQDVVMTQARIAASFQGDLSPVVHQLREALMPSALLCFIQQGSVVHFIGRSSSEKVDVAQIAELLGGNGHSRAAAARVKEAELTAVINQVNKLLPEAVEPLMRVQTLMSYRVKIFEQGLLVRDVAETVRQLGYEGYPVVNESMQVCGLLTRRAIDRAMAHGLSDLPIVQIMKQGSYTVRPTDPVDQVQRIMQLHGWGQVPVVEADETDQLVPIGIVTRTDMLNYLFKQPQKTAESNLKQLLAEQLPYPIWQLVHNVAPIVLQLQMPLYFVGGPVRDLLLERPFKDIDIVVEGNAVELVQQLRQHFGGKVRPHERFGTVKWLINDDVWQKLSQPLDAKATTSTPQARPADETVLPSEIDFVTARTEYYPYPTALPEVLSSSIKRDLQRRDFTINALAVRLDGSHFGELLDFYNGRRDLRMGLVRVLHSLSFIDDPTRLLRAVRFEQRLGFAIASDTLRLVPPGLPLLQKISGDRLRHEIELILAEEKAAAMLARLDELGILQQIAAGLGWQEETAVYFSRLESLAQLETWERTAKGEQLFVRLALWLSQQEAAIRQETLRRLMVRRQVEKDVFIVQRLLRTLESIPATAKPSELVSAINGAGERVLLTTAVLAQSAHIADWLVAYMNSWRHVKTAVTGNDLRARGLSPGPAYAMILQDLRDAWLDQTIETAAEELTLLEQLIANLNA